MKALGATEADIGQGPDVTWTVLADPEGNVFCVLSPSMARPRVNGRDGVRTLACGPTGRRAVPTGPTTNR